MLAFMTLTTPVAVAVGAHKIKNVANVKIRKVLNEAKVIKNNIIKGV